MNTPHPESVRKKTGAERRRWARVSSDMPITLQTPRGAVQARMRDVSRAGVCFYMDQPLPLMTMLQLDLPLGKHLIRGGGAVVRCEKISKHLDHWEVAVFLHDMTESDRDLLDSYINQKLDAAKTA
ncbi:MAG: PilZ domain [Planctomycetota bacterium]|jgi:hypothetical protein